MNEKKRKKEIFYVTLTLFGGNTLLFVKFIIRKYRIKTRFFFIFFYMYMETEQF